MADRNLRFLPPSGYRCDDCGANGVKLWREYQTFLEHQRLRCRACAEKNQPDRRSTSECDTAIGWLVCAVPTLDGSYWGYTSIPQDALNWWRSLPETQEVNNA